MMAGQTINDRLLAARHSLAGQGLAKSVCKATTEEMIGPKKKHLDYLIHCTNEPNVSIPHLANLLIERSQNANWVVVYKALITAHHLLAYGNERFIQYLASSNSSFNLSNFLDKGGVQGAISARIGYDMSPFIRRYAKYLNEKALSYRTVAFDFCKVKRGKEEGSLRTMNADKLLKTLPVLQAQLDGLLEFDCQANDLTNGVINMCFMLLFRDLIRLFACYNDGIINLLEKYFDMNKKQCRDALDLYKKFLVRMDRVGEFLKVAENVGIDKGDIPDLTKAPSSLLEALEGHLNTLEGKKGSAANTPTQAASQQKNIKSGVSALSSTSSSFGTAAASTRFDSQTNGIDESIKAQALAEEEAVLNQYKSKVSSPTGGNTQLTNPFLATPPGNSQANIVDLFGGPAMGNDGNQAAGKASDDLLQLGNPFSDVFDNNPAAPAVPGMVQNQNMWANNFSGVPPVQPQSNAFVSDSNFSSVFGSSEPAGHYLQAAQLDPNIPNPFIMNEYGNQTQTGDANKFGIGGGGNQQQIKAGPPQRPPPISGHSGSPAHGTPSKPKSAFDDLNETIRMALGSSGSPAKTADSQKVMGAQQNQPNQTSASVFSASPNHQNVNNPSTGGFDALGDVLKPGVVGTTNTNELIQTGSIINTGAHSNQTSVPANNGKVLTGDLDSSLASLAENLTINKSASSQVKGGIQWNSPKNTMKPGANWTPQPMAATTGAGYRPMAQSMSPSPAPSTAHHSFIHASYPAMTPYYMPQNMGMRPMMMHSGNPMGMAQPGMMPMGMGVQPMMTPQMGSMQSPMMMQPQHMDNSNVVGQNGNKNVQLDPFGAL